MSKNNGGPAFPTDGRIQHGTEYDGMSLRDWFASQATGDDIKAHMKWVERRGAPLGIGDFDCSREMAKYRYADAMLAERAKQESADD